MKESSVLLIITLILISFTPNSVTGQVPVSSLNQIGSKYFELIKIRNFDSASQLFHYPKHYSKQERLNDLNFVSRMLNLVTEELGEITAKSKLQTSAAYIDLVISGGDIPYWKKHPYSVRLEYDTRFKRDGNGYVIIFFCNIDNKWEISKVAYGLPASHPNSKNRILEIVRKTSLILKPPETKQEL